MHDIRQAQDPLHLGLEQFLVERPEASRQARGIAGFDNLHPAINQRKVFAVVRVDLNCRGDQGKHRTEQQDPGQQPEGQGRSRSETLKTCRQFCHVVTSATLFDM